MKQFNLVFAAMLATAFLAGCGDKNSTPTPAGTNAADATGYLDTLVQAKKTADKTIDATFLNQEVQLFYAQEGRFPKDLAELVPKYIPQIPAAPAGSKITYDAVKGEVKVVKE
jgi:hypothetical protein